jgi:hypothetical protein
MPYLQPRTANYFGFMPAVNFGSLIQTNAYLVSSSEGAIFAGDVVMMTTLDTARSITGAFGTPTSSAAILGVAAQFLAANGGSTAALLSGTSTQLLLVYDDPAQIYVGCDTTSGVIGVGPQGLFKNYTILASGAVGSTGPNTVSLNRSVMAISGVTATVAGALHLVGLHPVEQGLYSTVATATAAGSSETRKWLCQFVQTVKTQVGTNIGTVVNTTS